MYDCLFIFSVCRLFLPSVSPSVNPWARLSTACLVPTVLVSSFANNILYVSMSAYLFPSVLLFNVCLSVNSSVRPFFSSSVRQCACLFDSPHTGLATDRQKNSDPKETRTNCYTDWRLQICCWFRRITNSHFMLLKGPISIYDLRGFLWNPADNNVSLSIHWYRGFVWAL